MKISIRSIFTIIFLIASVAFVLYSCSSDEITDNSFNYTTISTTATSKPPAGSTATNTDKINVDEINVKGTVLKYGMTYDEFANAFGCEGIAVGNGARVYEWKLEDGRYLFAYFYKNSGEEKTLLCNGMKISENPW